LDNPNDCENDCTSDDESNIVPINVVEDPEYPEKKAVNASPYVPGLIWPTRKTKRQAEMVMVTVIEVETQRNN